MARSHARFCSTRCRVAAHRVGPPKELRDRPRWVRHDERKRPLRADGTGLASSTDRETWATHEAAARSRVGTGRGFVLDGDGIVCIDLDHCLIAGQPTPAARRFLAQLPDTYVEVSPSGDGLHIWGRGRVDHGRRLRRGGLDLEVYGTGRYITVTGRRVRGAHLADLSEVLTSVL